MIEGRHEPVNRHRTEVSARTGIVVASALTGLIAFEAIAILATGVASPFFAIPLFVGAALCLNGIRLLVRARRRAQKDQA